MDIPHLYSHSLLTAHKIITQVCMLQFSTPTARHHGDEGLLLVHLWFILLTPPHTSCAQMLVHALDSLVNEDRHAAVGEGRLLILGKEEGTLS